MNPLFWKKWRMSPYQQKLTRMWKKLWRKLRPPPKKEDYRKSLLNGNAACHILCRLKVFLNSTPMASIG
jgi:hypothetical protein